MPHFKKKHTTRELPSPQKSSLLDLPVRLWRGELSFSVMAGIFMLAIPALLHLTASRLMLPLIEPQGAISDVFFTAWICSAVLYAAAICIGMWRTKPPSCALPSSRLPKLVAGLFFFLSLLYGAYLFLSWIYLDAHP